jgi:hypothetical protein
MMTGITSNSQVKKSYGLIADHTNTTPNMVNKLIKNVFLLGKPQRSATAVVCF